MTKEYKMHAISIIFNAIAIVLWLFILYYITNLETIGCKCALDWRRTFIQYYIIYLLLMIIFMSPDAPPILLTLHFIISISFIVIVYHYIHDLKVKKCKCSESAARDVLMFINYIQIFMVMFVLILLVHLMFEFRALLKNAKSPQKLKACLRKA